MSLSWQDFAKLHAPLIALVAINVLGGIYAYGYRCGQRSMLVAAADAALEAAHG